MVLKFEVEHVDAGKLVAALNKPAAPPEEETKEETKEEVNKEEEAKPTPTSSPLKADVVSPSAHLPIISTIADDHLY